MLQWRCRGECTLRVMSLPGAMLPVWLRGREFRKKKASFPFSLLLPWAAVVELMGVGCLWFLWGFGRSVK